MSKFRFDLQHLPKQQQVIINKKDQNDKTTRNSYNKSVEKYKDYTIAVQYNNNTYEAVGTKEEYRESSYGDTKEDAIKHLKEKIDNINAYKEIYK